MIKHLDVKPFQEKLYVGYCGPASLKIVLNYYGIEADEEALAQKLGVSEELGTTNEDIARVAKQFGLQAEIHANCDFSDIEKWLEKDVPVIVDWFTSGRFDYPEDITAPDGHCSVVCGVDETHIYLQDPEIGTIRKLKKDVFERVWFDFTGMTIKPDELTIRALIAIYK